MCVLHVRTENTRHEYLNFILIKETFTYFSCNIKNHFKTSFIIKDKLDTNAWTADNLGIVNKILTGFRKTATKIGTVRECRN